MAGTLKKMTAEYVISAIQGYENGSSLGDLAHKNGVSRQAMYEILKRRITLRPKLRFGPENHFYRGGRSADGKAHDKMEKAVLRGKLINPGICSACKNGDRFKDGRTSVQGHHDDYNAPLKVRWLCQGCHHEWHKHNRPIQCVRAKLSKN